MRYHKHENDNKSGFCKVTVRFIFGCVLRAKRYYDSQQLGPPNR